MKKLKVNIINGGLTEVNKVYTPTKPPHKYPLKVGAKIMCSLRNKGGNWFWATITNHNTLTDTFTLHVC